MTNSRVQKFKQNLILQAASMLFVNNSYDSVTVEDIAREAGFSKGTVYSYFSGKDEILFHVLHDELESYCSAMQDILDHLDDPSSALEQVIAMYCRSFWKRSRLLIHFCSRCRNKNRNENFKKEWYEEIKAMKNRRTALMADILSESMRQNLLLPRQDPWDLARILEAMMRGVGITSFLNNRTDGEKDMEKAVDIIYHGILRKNGREKSE